MPGEARVGEPGKRAGEAAVEPEPMAPYADELVNYAYNNLNELITISDPGDKTLVYDA